MRQLRHRRPELEASYAKQFLRTSGATPRAPRRAQMSSRTSKPFTIRDAGIPRSGMCHHANSSAAPRQRRQPDNRPSFPPPDAFACVESDARARPWKTLCPRRWRPLKRGKFNPSHFRSRRRSGRAPWTHCGPSRSSHSRFGQSRCARYSCAARLILSIGRRSRSAPMAAERLPGNLGSGLAGQRGRKGGAAAEIRSRYRGCGPEPAIRK